MSIPSIKQAANGVWYVHWTDGRRSKRESLGTREKDEAKARFAQWLIVDGQNKGTAPIEYTVADLWTVYEKGHVVTLSSPATAKFSWKNLAPHFAHLAPRDVPSAVPAYIAKRSRTVKPATIRRDLVQLRAILNWAADARRGKPFIDPVPAFILPKEGPPRDRWLTDMEVQRLYAASDDERITLFMRLALETAGRKAALLELTWDRVDFDTMVIHLANPSRETTKKRRASVPISPTLLPYLQDAYAARRGTHVLGRGGDVYQQIQRIAKLAKVPGVSPNVFRHTAATKMARRGVPLWIIAKVLGNSLDMVERVYAKHAPDDLRAAVHHISGRN